LRLREPIYQPTASYGHFGNTNYPWEVLDSAKIKALQAIIGINQSSV
jgi:S-adenosylmethionine synthetase